MISETLPDTTKTANQIPATPVRDQTGESTVLQTAARPLPKHPRTRRSWRNYTRPLWRETRRLVRGTQLIGHTLVGAFIAITALGPLLRRRRHDTVVRWWVRGILRILNVRLEIEGRAHAEPTLFAANHISWLDIPCLRAALDAEFVSKQEVSRWPVIGHMAGRAGTLFLNRGERDASLAAANSMGQSLASGRSVVIFPEGTTGDGQRLGRFHARLYQAAIRHRRPVQAVAVTYPHPRGVHPAAPFVGNDSLGRHVWTLLGEDHLTVRIVFCPPVTGTGERRALAERTRTQIAIALGLEPAIPVHHNVIAV